MSPLIDELRQRWQALLAELDLSEYDRDFDQIVTAYSEQHRHYHTLEHVLALLREIDGVEDQFSEPERARLAAWFHDIVYNTRGSSNERDSADIARRELTKMGADAGLIDRVSDLIVATADHQGGGSDPDDNLFLDIDFSILGAEPADYDRYAEAIRREYSWAPGPLYRQGRRKFLKSAAAQARTFLTDFYEDRLGEQARANMRRELIQLGGKP